MEAIAPIVAASGARIMRGGAFKPRTSPYIPGHGRGGPEASARRRRHGLKVVSEVMDRRSERPLRRHPAGRRAQHAELRLLKDSARSASRSCSSAASLPRSRSCCSRRVHPGRRQKQVILCERGIRTYETSTRNTLDIRHPGEKDGRICRSSSIRATPPACATWSRPSPAPPSPPVPTALIEVHNQSRKRRCAMARSRSCRSRYPELAAQLHGIASAIGRSFQPATV